MQVIAEKSDSDTDLAARFARDTAPLVDALSRQARRLTRCNADAEDLLQEIFLRLVSLSTLHQIQTVAIIARSSPSLITYLEMALLPASTAVIFVPQTTPVVQEKQILLIYSS